MKIFRKHPFFIFLILLASCNSSEKVIFEPFYYDCGTMAPESIFQKEVIVKNQTDLPVKIIDIKTDCGCTTSFTKENEISPNHFIDLVVNFNMPKDEGKIKRRVFVELSNNQKETLYFEANIVNHWIIKPHKILSIKSYVSGNVINRNLTIVSKNHKPFKITSIDTSSELLNIDYSVDSKSEHKININFLANKQEGFYLDYIKIKTDYYQQPLISIPVYVTY